MLSIVENEVLKLFYLFRCQNYGPGNSFSVNLKLSLIIKLTIKTIRLHLFRREIFNKNIPVPDGLLFIGFNDKSTMTYSSCVTFKEKLLAKVVWCFFNYFYYFFICISKPSLHPLPINLELF